MNKRYNITVVTRVAKVDEPGALEKKDTFNALILYDVDESVKAFIAESCSITLNQVLKYPTHKSGVQYILSYRTHVEDTEGKTVTDTGFINFPAMNHEYIVRFQRWAVNELNETISVREISDRGYTNEPEVSEVLTPATPIRTFLHIIIQLVRNWYMRKFQREKRKDAKN